MNYTTHRCRACYASLAGEPSWKTLCRPCFAESKKREQAELQDEVTVLRAEVAALRQRQGIEPQMVRTLLQLCHPDKHNDSPAATRATQYLLSLKRENADAAR